MKAAYEDQLKMLELHRLNVRISSLQHRRSQHPAHGHVKELQARAEDLRRASVQQSAVISDTQRELTKVQDEEEKVRTRRELQQSRLDGNEVPMRDVSALQHEIERMDQRLSDLEGRQLEIMERLETAESAKEAMITESAAIRDDVDATKKEFEVDVADLDRELREANSERESLRAVLPPELLEEYDRSWSRNGALAVLELHDGVVVGGLAELSPAELDSIRAVAPDDVVWTEDLQLIVVRTTER